MPTEDFPEELSEKDPLDEMETSELIAEVMRSNIKQQRRDEERMKGLTGMPIGPFGIMCTEPPKYEYKVLIGKPDEAAARAVEKALNDGFLPLPMSQCVFTHDTYFVYVGARKVETVNG